MRLDATIFSTALEIMYLALLKKMASGTGPISSRRPLYGFLFSRLCLASSFCPMPPLACYPRSRDTVGTPRCNSSTPRRPALTPSVSRASRQLFLDYQKVKRLFQTKPSLSAESLIAMKPMQLARACCTIVGSMHLESGPR